MTISSVMKTTVYFTQNLLRSIDMYFDVCNKNENWYRIHAVNFLCHIR